MSESNEKAPVIAYPIKDSLYLNITNRCPNKCIFCIRKTPKGVGYHLWLEQEPTVEEVMDAVGDPRKYREIVFCGYGEPLLRPEVVTGVAAGLKKSGAKTIRLNTNGLSDLFLGYDVLPQLKGLVDAISISLNAHDPISYQKVSQSPYGERSFPAVLEFTKRARTMIPQVILSVVGIPEVDPTRAAQVAADLGVEFRVREYSGE